jgi:hypothetical protein
MLFLFIVRNTFLPLKRNISVWNHRNIWLAKWPAILFIQWWRWREGCYKSYHCLFIFCRLLAGICNVLFGIHSAAFGISMSVLAIYSTSWKYSLREELYQ